MPPKCLQIRTHGVGVGAINLRGGEIKGEASSLKEGAVPRGQLHALPFCGRTGGWFSGSAGGLLGGSVAQWVVCWVAIRVGEPRQVSDRTSAAGATVKILSRESPAPDLIRLVGSQTATKRHRSPETFKDSSRPETRVPCGNSQLNEHDDDDSFEGAAVEVELIIAAFFM
uniref:HDC15083 n=1 Tax=Drosophila melanogaster TaxID=7227 RepID=Q6IJE5_DROME|nr:TPA_inf: HDC15083 [Drosophila melanogaster]